MMRPDKPGVWLWEDIYGVTRAVELRATNDGLRSAYKLYLDGRYLDNLEPWDIENFFDFKWWIGEAVPKRDCKECDQVELGVGHSLCHMCSSNFRDQFNPKRA